MTAVTALLGRRDAPTDGVEDYCTWLGRALANKGRCLNRVRVPWQETGWLRALRWLWRESAGWRERWVLVQYTAMSWSRHGFPFGLLAVLAVLQCRSCRVAAVFHDPSGFPGHRWIDYVRRACQHWIMWIVYRLAEQTIHNVPVNCVSWIRPGAPKASFIPIGASVPAVTRRGGNTEQKKRGKRTIVVFGVTGGAHRDREVADIALAVSRADQNGVRIHLVVLGRGSEEAGEALRQALNGSNLELSVLGLLPAEDISRVLAQADVLLFVRGPFSSQRSSGIAGIACGLPIVGYSGSQTGPPITEAGVMLVPYGDREALAEALSLVLSDEQLWQQLHERSIRAYQRCFSWDAIAEQFVKALDL
jgi:glycosyltransferase involved in cell wall biosynthesis